MTMAENEIKIKSLPLLPLKNSVLFPGLLMPLSVGRAGSVAAVEAALATEDKEIVVVTQREVSIVETGSKFVGLIQSPETTPQDLARMFTSQEDPLRLAYMIASIMNLETSR